MGLMKGAGRLEIKVQAKVETKCKSKNRVGESTGRGQNWEIQKMKIKETISKMGRG